MTTGLAVAQSQAESEHRKPFLQEVEVLGAREPHALVERPRDPHRLRRVQDHLRMPRLARQLDARTPSTSALLIPARPSERGNRAGSGSSCQYERRASGAL